MMWRSPKALSTCCVTRGSSCTASSRAAGRRGRLQALRTGGAGRRARAPRPLPRERSKPGSTGSPKAELPRSSRWRSTQPARVGPREGVRRWEQRELAGDRSPPWHCCDGAEGAPGSRASPSLFAAGALLAGTIATGGHAADTTTTEQTTLTETTHGARDDNDRRADDQPSESPFRQPGQRPRGRKAATTSPTGCGS